jgi:hypothetical protein
MDVELLKHGRHRVQVCNVAAVAQACRYACMAYSLSAITHGMHVHYIMLCLTVSSPLVPPLVRPFSPERL